MKYRGKDVRIIILEAGECIKQQLFAFNEFQQLRINVKYMNEEKGKVI